MSQDDPSVRFQKPKSASNSLRFTVEILATADEGVRILARVHSHTLARAVFEAGQEEFPGRILVLRDGQREIARTEAGGQTGAQ